MNNLWIRQARAEDAGAIEALNRLAFGTPEEAQIIDRLGQDGDSLASLVAHNDREVLGHIQFFKIAVDGADIAAGLGPMSVLPEVQHKGIGSGLIRLGLTLMEGQGRRLVFVLGHPDYYPKFGFSAALAAAFTAPWSGPAFMALQCGATDPEGPTGGALTYPAAFGT
ncbi:MAG: N-acetyltransferase [Pseudomonadota bacterium]